MPVTLHSGCAVRAVRVGVELNWPPTHIVTCLVHRVELSIGMPKCVNKEGMVRGIALLIGTEPCLMCWPCQWTGQWKSTTTRPRLSAAGRDLPTACLLRLSTIALETTLYVRCALLVHFSNLSICTLYEIDIHCTIYIKPHQAFFNTLPYTP